MTQTTELLKEIYRLYDAQIDTLDLACRKGCADCCTANVTMTRLEAMLLVNELAPEEQTRMFDRLAPHADIPGFRPALTTNGFAEICMSGGEPPEDAAEPGAGACPLLADGLCTVYRLRPFGCRCMLSTRPCRQSGQAEINDFILTVNTVFLQFIEQLDRDGFFGNLTDVLLRLARHSDQPPSDTPVISTRPIPALMVPAEHRDKIRPLFAALNDLLAGLQ